MIGPRQLKSAARQCAIVSARELWLRERAIARERVGVGYRASPRQFNPQTTRARQRAKRSAKGRARARESTSIVE